MQLLQRLRQRLGQVTAYLYFVYQSKRNQLRALMRKHRVIYANSYTGQPIMLMALFEEGVLRPDVLAFLEAAKQQGIYTLCVNTLRVDQPAVYAASMDCYIERPNFGRDFGSYKLGFQYVYDNGLAERCPRLMMVNDSVFFSAKHSNRFIAEMFSSSVEALGATETHDVQHHLGSFCIALSGRLLNEPRFETFWRRYTCTDVRPTVIESGEMALSKRLRTLVSSPDQYRALYDVARAGDALRDDPTLLEDGPCLRRDSDVMPWPRFSFAAVAESLNAKYLCSVTRREQPASGYIEQQEALKGDAFFASSFTSFAHGIDTLVIDSEPCRDTRSQVLREEVIAHFMACFSRGSQIHQNNVFLHRIGLPIIKLDGMFRGAFSARDVERLAADLDEGQRQAFRRMLYARPYGAHVLSGWRRWAFLYGFI